MSGGKGTGLQNPTSGQIALSIGFTDYDNWTTAPFYVTHSGELYAKSGKIGGWIINSNSLQYIKSGEINVCLNTTEGQPVFYCTTGSIDDSFFKINRNGTIYAKNADISGTINASNGYIGNWEINNTGITAQDSNGKWTGLRLPAGESKAYSFFTGASSASGNGASFIAYSDGSLYASNANITGTIQANAGNFGAWRVDGVQITANGTLLTTSIYANGVAAWAKDGTDYNAGWDEICETAVTGYSSNGNSDRSVKNSIKEYNDKYDVLFDNLKPCLYKYNYGTSNRFHTGFIAQDVLEAINNSGLSTLDFAAYVEFSEKNRYNSKFAIRRDEIVSLNTWQIQKLKNRLKNIESILESLTNK